MSETGAAHNSGASPDATSIAGVVIRDRRAEPPALAAGLFNAVRSEAQRRFYLCPVCFRVDRADQTQSQQAGEALCLCSDEGVES